MIRWLSERLAHNPDAVFWRNELEARFPRELEMLLAQKLLQPVTVDLDGTYYDHRTGRTFSLVTRDGEIEGWDEDDPGALPIILRPLDLARFTLDLAQLASRFQAANGLIGPAERLHARLYSLGTTTRNGSQTAIVLAFCPMNFVAVDLLRGLPSRFPDPPDRIVAITPAHVSSLADRQVLATLHVFPVPLGDPDPFVVETDLRAVPDVAPLPETENAFRKAGDAWMITYEGREVSVRHLVGIPYLAFLVRHPVLKHHILDLVRKVEGLLPGEAIDAQEAIKMGLTIAADTAETELIDKDARQAYQGRLAQLEEKARVSSVSAEEQQEARWLAEQLKSGSGLGGRPRKTASRGDLEQVRVHKAIRRAIDRLKEIDVHLGQHLDNTVSTGRFCSYTPDHAIRWAP